MKNENTGKTILVVDDEPAIVDVLEFNLRKNGYHVISAYDGQEALEKLNLNHVDCVILDLMLPNIGGLEVCRIVRSTPNISTTPIIMLTAKSEETDKVIGLGIGADDYMTKPFSIRELFARVDVQIRRKENLYHVGNVIRTKHFKLNIDERVVFCEDQKLDFTQLEFEIFKTLFLNMKKNVERETLLSIKSDGNTLNSGSLDVHISKIRRKIKDVSNDLDVIQTIRGVGYHFND